LVKRKDRTVKKGLLVSAIFLAVSVSRPAAAQSLPPQVQALYPEQAGEVVFVDLRAVRQSPHYSEIKAKVLPERLRQLEQFAQVLGIDFDRQVEQLSWVFVGPPEGGAVQLVGVAEGSFPPREIAAKARAAKLDHSRAGNATLVNMGRNAQGQEFIYAFQDRTTALFGFREAVMEALGRHAQGGPSLADNATLRSVIQEVNGKAPLWVALDHPYTLLAVKQVLPQATTLPGFDTLAERLESASVQLALKEGLQGQAAVRCQSSADALLLSTLVQAALAYQSYQMAEKNPELARAMKEATVSRQGERVELRMSLREADLVALLQKNSLTLSF
jgi:hypothetical protein